MRAIIFSTAIAGMLMLAGASPAFAQRGGFHGGPHFYGPRVGWGVAYSPFWYGPGYPYYAGYGPYGVAPYAVTGGLRLEVSPKTAQVFVDGYGAGVVDDFDGHFQHLNLTPGGHRIEVSAPGFQTLTFDTLIQPDHTTDYKAQMLPDDSAAPR